MAEQDEGGQRPAPSPNSGGGGGGNVFTRKLMGVPVWILMIAGLGIALAYSSWRKNKAATPTSSTTSSTTSADSLASQTPPFIIQNYTSTGSPGPAGPAGATGATGPAGPAGASGTFTQPISGIEQGSNPPRLPPVAMPPVSTVTSNPPPVSTAPAAPIKYTVKPGDNLSAIAGSFGIPGGRSTGWQILWNFNTNLANRTSAGIPPVIGNNPNLIYPGEIILIPQS